MDDAVAMSIRNQLRPFCDPGSDFLDAQGRGFAPIDPSAFPPLNTPAWPAMVVSTRRRRSASPTSPGTYVMRL